MLRAVDVKRTAERITICDKLFRIGIQMVVRYRAIAVQAAASCDEGDLDDKS